MTLCRVLSLVAVLAVASAYPAQAQFGGMPGMPGLARNGWLRGAAGRRPPPDRRPPASSSWRCGTKVQKNAAAIGAANKRKARPAGGLQAVQGLPRQRSQVHQGYGGRTARPAASRPRCIKQAQDGHSKAAQIAKQVCDAAAHGRGRPARA